MIHDDSVRAVSRITKHESQSPCHPTMKVENELDVGLENVLDRLAGQSQPTSR